jgi:hypothetical protein
MDGSRHRHVYGAHVVGVPATSPLSTNTSGGYRIQTGINANPGVGGEVARDHRDILSLGRTTPFTWAKTRVNDGPAYLDDFLPEVQVASDGYPYVLWYDWRDGNCGGSSATYVARSTTGGYEFLRQPAGGGARSPTGPPRSET